MNGSHFGCSRWSFCTVDILRRVHEKTVTLYTLP